MTCVAGVLDFGEFGKGAAESIFVELDFLPNLTEYWTPATFVPVGKVIRPTKANGWAMIAENEGETAFKEPRWSVPLDAQTQDGSVRWRTISPVANGFDSIVSVVAEPISGLVISEVTGWAAQVRLRVAGGSKGSSYEVPVFVTTASGEVIEGRFRVCVS